MRLFMPIFMLCAYAIYSFSKPSFSSDSALYRPKLDYELKRWFGRGDRYCTKINGQFPQVTYENHQLNALVNLGVLDAQQYDANHLQYTLTSKGESLISKNVTIPNREEENTHFCFAENNGCHLTAIRSPVDVYEYLRVDFSIVCDVKNPDPLMYNPDIKALSIEPLKHWWELGWYNKKRYWLYTMTGWNGFQQPENYSYPEERIRARFGRDPAHEFEDWL